MVAGGTVAEDAKSAAVVDLYALGARVVSVFGPFGSRVLIDMPSRTAERMFPDGLSAARRSQLLDAVDRDVAALGERDPKLAESALAASAAAMAIEIEHPYNSATSKSMCQARLLDALRELRDLAPPEEKKGKLHDIRSARSTRLTAAGGSGS